MENKIDMEKIELSQTEKELLKKINESASVANIAAKEQPILITLSQKELIVGRKDEQKNYIAAKLTEKGKAYILENPKLKNPSIWNDKKYVINTIFSAIATIISLIALYISIIK